MYPIQTALYARVSSEQQAEAHTIASQVAALRERVTTDGLVVPASMAFLDDGYSGATLVRPALERLRDVAAAGGLDRLYVQCPDRLARNYAHQVVLMEELTRAGVEVVFLNRPLGQTAEDHLLVQVQGVIAEYERAKFLERSRRGKRHAAQSGNVGMLGHAPYGYRYICKQEGGGTARFEVLLEEARVVRDIFRAGGRGALYTGRGAAPGTDSGRAHAHGHGTVEPQDHLGSVADPRLHRGSSVWPHPRRSARAALARPTRTAGTVPRGLFTQSSTQQRVDHHPG